MATLRTVTIKSSGGDYASLAAMDAAEGKDLVTLDRQLRIELYDVLEGSFTLTGWTTSATCYVEIVGVNWAGVWDSNIARMEVTDASGLIISGCNHCRVRGFPIKLTQTTGSTTRRAVWMNIGLSSGADIRIEDAIWWGIRTGGTGSLLGLGVSDSSPTYRFRNILAHGFNSHGFDFSGANSINAYVYNCAAINCGTGFTASGDTPNQRLKNCGASGCTDGFAGVWNAASDFNVSDIAADAPGASSAQGTPTFVDAPNRDYHLAAGDTAWRGAGTDLSADASYAFATDIDGQARSAWDVGPDEFVASGGSGPSAAAKRRYRQIIGVGA